MLCDVGRKPENVKHERKLLRRRSRIPVPWSRLPAGRPLARVGHQRNHVRRGDRRWTGSGVGLAASRRLGLSRRRRQLRHQGTSKN